MQIKLYNTLTRAKEEFKSINDNEVKMYCCGPTVYYFSHIGNLRAYLFSDTLRKVLEYNDYKVKQVINITDVGHLVSDADEGEDKMIKAARRENKDPYKIADFYTEYYKECLKKLNVTLPFIFSRATEHIKDMEEYVQQIIKNGYAYETSNTIYFDTSKLKDYGKVLSNRNVEDQQAGARVEFDKEKKNFSDFAIWIKAPEEHLMKWNTFWGICYPGWHLECSAMSRKYLGEVFDIHTGGIDHIPVHHENEIAQSKGCTGKNPANYWMHSDFLLVDNKKMSKSLNNLYTLEDLKEKGFEPLAYRMFNFGAHYRSNINFTWQAIEAAQIALNRLREGYQKHCEGTEDVADEIIGDFENRFHEAINDDLNMQIAMSIVWEIIKYNVKSKKIADLLLKFDEVLSLDIDKKEELVIPEEILKLAEKRKQARNEKNWNLSDELRNEINKLGYNIKDGKANEILITKI